jgi:hypothetical protein
MSKLIVRDCLHCGRRFSPYPGNVAKGAGRYCSRSCTGAAKTARNLLLENIALRFWPKVNKSGPILRIELGPCWIWIAHRKTNGYGTIGIGERTYHAHRVAWLLENGSWPTPMALHKCDGGEIGCVRIDHLFEGDDYDNARDKVSKGRQFRGETSPLAKLTERDVLAIRAAVSARTPRRAIAQQFAISESTVCDIIKGRSWRHVAAP